MNQKATRFAEALYLNHGAEHALAIANRSLTVSLRGDAITYFGEADYHVNQNGHLEYSKNQSGKFESVRLLRIKKAQNFWKDVHCYLNKKQNKKV